MKEREQRIKKDIRILLKDGESSCSATIINFSRNGMSIKTDRVFPTYKMIDIIVKIGSQKVPLQASVRWVKESPVNAAERYNEVGLSLPNPPPEYACQIE